MRKTFMTIAMLIAIIVPGCRKDDPPAHEARASHWFYVVNNTNNSIILSCNKLSSNCPSVFATDLQSFPNDYPEISIPAGDMRIVRKIMGKEGWVADNCLLYTNLLEDDILDMEFHIVYKGKSSKNLFNKDYWTYASMGSYDLASYTMIVDDQLMTDSFTTTKND
jgi:hypothetical protein